jgi:hypothetical protein
MKHVQSPMKMEKSGIEPEIAICKIDVLPIKLYPLPFRYISFNVVQLHIHIRMIYSISCNMLISYFFSCLFSYPKNDLNVYDKKSVSLKFTLSTNSSIRINKIKKY